VGGGRDVPPERLYPVVVGAAVEQTALGGACGDRAAVEQMVLGGACGDRAAVEQTALGGACGGRAAVEQTALGCAVGGCVSLGGRRAGVHARRFDPGRHLELVTAVA